VRKAAMNFPSANQINDDRPVGRRARRTELGHKTARVPRIQWRRPRLVLSLGSIAIVTALSAGAGALPALAAPADIVVSQVTEPPALTGVEIDGGPEIGGTVLTLTGTGFTDATEVTIDGVSRGFELVDDETITLSSPAHEAGEVQVVVTSPAGASEPLSYTYVFVADEQRLTPDEGLQTGDTFVTITGTNLATASAVWVDGAETDISERGEGTVSFRTFAHAPGTVPVVVYRDGVPSEPMDFTFLDVPNAVATNLEPTSGPAAGGTTVTVTGTGFNEATGVTFNGVAGWDFSVDSDTQITVVTPAGPPDTVWVVVEADSGNSQSLYFTFNPLPVLTGLQPDSGPESGGTGVTLIGDGFRGATDVTVDGDSVAFEVVDGSSPFDVGDTLTIYLATPPHAPGDVPVVVTGPGGVSDPVSFTYTTGTVIDTVDPATGPEGGTNSVNLTGACFTGATAVLFGYAAVRAGDAYSPSFTVISDTEMAAIVPAGAGLVDVTVVGADSCGTVTIPNGYEYAPAPGLTALSPDSGSSTGGTQLRMRGTGFAGATAVTVDGVSVGFTIEDERTITVTIPAHAPGSVPVVVVGPGGVSAPLPFLFTAASTVDGIEPSNGPDTGGNQANSVSLTPDSGPDDGGTRVTILGSGFTDVTSVTFGGRAGTALVVISDTELRVLSPPHRAGVVDVVVTTPDGAGNALAFGYLATADTAVNPPTGTDAAGGGSDSGDGLASTGFDPGIGAAGLLLLSLGGTLVLMTRRGRATEHP
jgi:hypothetical protein